MSLVAWDARFGLKQEELSRNGFVRKAGETVSKMTKDEYHRFMNSPAMSASDRFREVCGLRTSVRDKKRMETDPSFRPSDDDWKAKKAFDFNPRVDYYRVLGVDEYEAQEGIKKAYRQLSLVYHPDKTAGMEEAAAAEYQQIFIEIKNAYLVLHDQATRRQYDKARDDAEIADELFGQVKRKKAEAQFDAFKALERLAASKPKASATVTVYVPVKLEKMFYGGIKAVPRERRRQLLDRWVLEELVHKVLVPRRCPERHPFLRKAAGNHHEHQRPDHLSFRLCGKQHPRVVREGIDICLRSAVRLPAGAVADPYLSCEAEGLGGRVVLLFGRNPFRDLPAFLARRRLRVALLGEGFDPSGRLRFDVDYPTEASSSSSPPGTWETRARRRGLLAATCDAELAELRSPLALGTSPSATLHFYGNLRQLAAVEPSANGGMQRVRPRPLFAVVLSCPLGAKRRFQGAWAQLRASLLPLLWFSFWILVPPMRRLQPRHLDNVTAAGGDPGVADAGSGAVTAALARAADGSEARCDAGPDVEGFLRRFRLGPPGGFVERRPRWAASHRDEVACRPGRYDGWGLYPRAPGRPAAIHGGSQSCSGLPATTSDDVTWRLRAADRVFAEGYYWLAYSLYTEAAAVAGAPVDVLAGRLVADGSGDVDLGSGDGGRGEGCELAGAAVGRRADCLLHLRDFSAARVDAAVAAAWLSRSGAAWRRLGVLEARLGEAEAAAAALLRAVSLDGRDLAAVEMLQRLQRPRPGDADVAALAEKVAGNAAFGSEPSKAIAHYTVALAALGVEPGWRPAAAGAGAGGTGAGSREETEERVRLIAELLCNRAGAFTRLGGMRCWAAARRDAELALALPGREGWSVARLRLATALLGEGRPEEAYPHFARVAAALPTDASGDHAARRGLASCLALAGCWSSSAARLGAERGARDSCRPRAATRVFAVSDVHFDHPLADEWVDRISDSAFLEDVLIVAGDVAETLDKVRLCLRHLRAKFRRVFYTPGNHDLWLHPGEQRLLADSVHKLFLLLDLCREEDVDVLPADICEDVSVVPLFSWYNADFDLDDPFPTEAYGFDKYCKWPMDRHNEVWRYMMYLNRNFLERPRRGTVITFSHFLPRHGLPFWGHVAGLVKAVGCPQLDGQLRELGSACHVFGHSHLQCNEVIDGVRYVQNPLGYKGEHGPEEPLLCIFDGARGLVAERRAPGG